MRHQNIDNFEQILKRVFTANRAVNTLFLSGRFRYLVVVGCNDLCDLFAGKKAEICRMDVTERELGFMRKAIGLSRQGIECNDGGPFGCVIVKGDEVVGEGWNRVTSLNDPTAHAEVVAIRDACLRLQSFQLEGCEIYTSCEPCPMCMGAIYWARPAKVYYANTRQDAAAAGFDDSLIYQEINSPIQDRKIPMCCIGEEEAVKVFQEWKEKENKTVY